MSKRRFTENRARRLSRGRVRHGASQVAQPAGLSLGEALKVLLASMGGTPERAGLQKLWNQWEAALGEELAALAQPLGQRKGRESELAGEQAAGQGAVLLLGVEDAMLLQELRFRSEEILARVNGFLGNSYFAEVRFSLPLGQNSPARTRGHDAAGQHNAEPQARAEPQALATGIFLDGMDAASPVARCYARFAKPGRASDEGERPALPKVRKNIE